MICLSCLFSFKPLRMQVARICQAAEWRRALHGRRAVFREMGVFHSTGGEWMFANWQEMSKSCQFHKWNPWLKFWKSPINSEILLEKRCIMTTQPTSVPLLPGISQQLNDLGGSSLCLVVATFAPWLWVEMFLRPHWSEVGRVQGCVQ